MEISEIGQCIHSHLPYDKSHTEVKGVRYATSVDNYCFIAKSCLTLWDHLDCITPDFPVLLVCLSSPDLSWLVSPRACSNLCPLSWWCYLTISSSATPFSFHLQLFPASASFPKSQLFASGGQSIGGSSSASVLPMSIQSWFPSGLTVEDRHCQ